MTTSNTGDNRPDHGRFKKGDARINRKGRPKTFDALRAEAIKIAGEVLTSPDGAQSISRINAILMDWALSKDVRKQQLLVEYAFGKVPSKEDVTITLSWREKAKNAGIDPDELFRSLVGAAKARTRTTARGSAGRGADDGASSTDE